MTHPCPPFDPRRDTRPSPVVFVVDDDVSVRESLEQLFIVRGWRCETFASAESFLARLPAEGPGCVVLDVSLPALDGLELQRRIADAGEPLPVVFLTGYGDVPMTVRAMKAGAIEFLTKPVRDTDLVQAVAAAIDRSQAVTSATCELRTLRERYAALSRREREVMAAVVAGLLNKQVAVRLRISEVTVKAHRGRVMRKMAADSLPDLVRMASALRLATTVGEAPVPPQYLRLISDREPDPYTAEHHRAERGR